MLSEHTKTDAVLAAPPVPTFDKPFCRFCPSGTSSNLVLIIFSYFDKIWNWQAQLSSVIAITQKNIWYKGIYTPLENEKG